MELQKGRPENTDGRLDKEIRVYDFLDKLGIQYQRIDHEAAMTMEACEEIDRALGDNTTICKNLFLCNRQETDFYLLLMPGDKPFKTKDLSAQIHSARLSFATPPFIFSARTVATITATSGFSPAYRHLISKNFSAPRSAPNPASVTT